MKISEFEVLQAKRAIARALANLRTCGTVEVLHDLDFAAIVRVTPLAPPDGMFDCAEWAAIREPVEMLVDPMQIVERLRREAA